MPERIAPPVQSSFRLAAIDVGSNSVHMVVAQIDSDGGVTTLYRLKEMVGLGRISFPNKELSKEAMDRAVQSLGRMKVAAEQRQVEKIVAIATSAIREASNGGELIRRIKDELKLNVKVVSAREEARLIYLGVRGAVDLGKKPHLMIDIGGGSVEFIVGDESEAKLLESRKLGAARMSATFVKSDPISKEDLKQLRDHYDEHLVPLAVRVRTLKPVKCLGTSGTMENIAALCGDGEHSRVIDRAKLLKLEERLLKTTAADRSRIRGLDDQRKEQIIAGVVLVASFMKRLDVKKIELCGAALREGILADYLSRHKPDLKVRRDVPDPRRRSVLDLARRCNWWEQHSQQTAKLLLRLFDDLKPLHKLGDHERELLEYAAWLHDIGWHIGNTQHHKHSAYLVRHGRLKGFTEDEIDTLAALTRYHRKSLPSKKHGMFRKLKPRDRRTVEVGAALLRIADGLDRSHASAVTQLNADIGKSAVTIKVKAPVDIQLELWTARDKRSAFESVFGREVEFIKA